jgi:hypothetical protein
MNKKLNKDIIHTKVGKYFMAVKAGKTKKEAQVVAGYAMDNKSTAIEATDTYKALQVHFADAFSKKMSMEEISDYLIDNIKQEGATRIDRNARNGAIKIALDKLEPEGGNKSDGADKVLIVLSK